MTATPGEDGSNEDMVTPQKRFSRGRLSRGRGLRKTTGCITCRKRHVKCDEKKPICGGCYKTRKSCDYASSDRPRKRQALSRTTSSPVDAAQDGDQDGKIASSPNVFDTPQPQQTPVGDAVSPKKQQDSGGFLEPAAISGPSPMSLGLEAQSMLSPGIDLSLQQQPGTPAFHSHLHHACHQQQINSAVPHQPQASSTTSSAHNLDNATARWVDLLFQDAVTQNENLWNINFESEGLNIFGNSVAQSPVEEPPEEPPLGPAASALCDADMNGGDKPISNESPVSHNPYLSERIADLAQEQVIEKRSWQSEQPLQILPHEHAAFQNFVRHMSEWMDFFDPHRPFAVLVPQLAMHNVGLMNAILALSARYLSLNPSSPFSSCTSATASSTVGKNHNNNDRSNSSSSNPLPLPQHTYAPQDALQYYYKTLHYIQKAMHHDTYKTSLELIATSLIISAYEMLGSPSSDSDSSQQDWERHLHGVFWIQRSQVIHGDSLGLRQAVWWAWLCQDVLAAFLERRRPFTFWRPLREPHDLDPHELAGRSVYYFAKVVGYCSREEVEQGMKDVGGRIARGRQLREELEGWRRCLTVEFRALPTSSAAAVMGLGMNSSGRATGVEEGRQGGGGGGGDGGEGDAFEPIWVNPPAFGVALQLHHAAQILLFLHQPVVGDFSTYASRRKSLYESIRTVCGIAMTLDDFASSVMSSQCLYIAGLPLENPAQRRRVLELLRDCQQRAGWPVKSLDKKLIQSWESWGHS